MTDEMLRIRIDGREVRVAKHQSLAAALLNAGVWSFREAVGKTARGPICGMGVCMECRVTIDGIAHRRACLEGLREGLDVKTR